MAATPRVSTLLKGKDVIFLIEKVPGSATFVLYGCMSAANLTNPGVEVEEIACRTGTFREPSGDAGLPTVAMESIVRYPATADVANNLSDPELFDLVVSGASRLVKLQFGINVGDMVLTGPGFFNQQTLNGPQTGNATGGITFNFSQQPVRSAVA